MAFDITHLRATRRAQTQRRLHELETLTPKQSYNAHRKRFAQSQRLALFYSQVIEVPNTGCFAWRGNSKSKSQGQYPMMSEGSGKCGHAVAWAYKHIRGLEPPTRNSGVELSHQCEENGLGSRCANPFHVEPESKSANLKRVPESKRKARMERLRSFIGKK